MLKKMDRLVKPSIGYIGIPEAGNEAKVEDLLSACSLQASGECVGQRSVDSESVALTASTDCELPLKPDV
jgi:hypothetical protein